jgi:plastocyanin
MKGARALAGGMVVLAASCAVPAISAAQDAGTTTDATTTTTAPAPTPPPPAPADTSSKPPNPTAPEAPPTGPAAGTPGEAPDQSRTADTSLSDSPPADGPGGGAHKAASASVAIRDFFFSPASTTIAVGDTVTWHNSGQATHNATADDGSFKTPDLNQGQSASHRFSTAGTFTYICTIHPNMHGTIRVLSATGSGSGGGGGGGGGVASSSSSGSANSEASGVASPAAAGDSNTLPVTGMALGGLAAVGLALLALGLIARLADRRRSGRRRLPIF